MVFMLVLLASSQCVLAQVRPLHDGWGWDHMMSWGGGAAMWIALLVLIGIVIYLALRGSGSASSREHPSETPLSVLQKRYARGEISKEEFEEKRRDLGI
jgi:putative membrane protein